VHNDSDDDYEDGDSMLDFIIDDTYDLDFDEIDTLYSEGSEYCFQLRENFML
jgi:hypothetical protein